MKTNFECNEATCPAFWKDKGCCIWGYEDRIDKDDPRTCPRIKKILEESQASQ